MKMEFCFTPSASETPLMIRSIKAGIFSRVSAWKVRTVPSNIAFSGITFHVFPEWMFVTLTTALCEELIFRLTIVCSAITI